MTPQVPDELLSAYFDGEASPEERTAVEKLLDGSVASRRELDEIAQLSALLHSFPREAAPVELASRVQRETDLLPLAEQKTVAPVRSLRREWMAACLGAAATAAALMLMVNLVDRPASHLQALRENDSATTRLALATTAAPAMERQLSEKESVVGEALVRDLTRFDDGSRKPEMSGADVAGAANQPVSAAAAMPRRSMSVQDEVRLEQQNSFDVNSKSKPLASFGNNGVVNDNSAAPVYLNNSDFLNGLRVGEVYQFVPQVADPESNVAVVDLAVLDIERGADQVQVLLSRNSIRPRQSGQAGLAGQAGNVAKQQSGKPSERSNSNDIVVVYSVGPGEHLAKALEDMSRQPELFLSWTTQPPVQLPIVENLAESKTEGVAANNSVASAKDAKRDQQAVSRSKPPIVGDGMDEDAARALNALLTRNNDANYGLANSVEVAANANGTTPEAVVDQPASSSASTVAKKALEGGNNNVFRRADQAPAVSHASKPEGDLKRSGAALDSAGSGRAYQQRFNLPTDIPAPVEPLLNNFQSQGMNSRGGANSFRGGTSNFMPQQNAGYGRSEGTRNEVKVLFVLHSTQIPTAPGAISPAKPNR